MDNSSGAKESFTSGPLPVQEDGMALAGPDNAPPPEVVVAAEPRSIVQWLRAHPTGFWFIFWGEFAERCSYYGMRAILAKYMADQLALGQANAATYNSFFIAACYFLPLLGGYVADRYLGKYWTIVSFSIPYILGHVILGVETFTFLVIALTLLAMGSGVIKPNISTLMGLTYDQQRPGMTKLRSDAFAIFYFSINIGAALSQFAMPPIRSNYGYAIAFLFPAVLMAVSFIIFAAGKRYYAKETIGAATRRTPEERAIQRQVLGRIFGLFLLVMFFWAIFDQSSSTWVFFTEACMNRHILGTEMDADQLQFLNPVLILILLPPVTLFVKWLQARGLRVRPTDKMIVGFLLTAGCMAIMALAAYLAGRAELRPGMVETAEKKQLRLTVEGGQASGAPAVYAGSLKVDATDPTTIGVTGQLIGADGKSEATPPLKLVGEGLLKLVPERDAKGNVTKLHIDGRITRLERSTKDGKTGEKKTETLREGDLRANLTGDMEVDERWFVAPQNQVTVWWLVIAYIMITIAEVLISVTGLELAYTAAPKSMTGFVTACWLLTVGLANLFINAPVTRLYTQMQPMTYFAILAGTLLAAAVAFIFVARRFNRFSEQSAP